MFRKIIKDKEIDITSLNQILKTSKKIINIGYFMAIIAIILLSTYLIKEWKLLKILGDLLVVISPIFIGILIAWAFDPLVTNLQKKKVPRLLGSLIAYVLLLGVLFLIAYIFVPQLLSQIKSFITRAPDIFQDISNFVMNFIKKTDTGNFININNLKNEIANNITDFGAKISADIPTYIFNVGKVIFNAGVNFILGLMIGFYLLYDFDKFNRTIYGLLPENAKDGYKELTHRINTSLRNYIQGLLLVMFLVFITQTIGLTLAGMEAPIVFALFCAITDIIPYFGPYIGAIPAIIVGFTISPITGICVIISILVVQLLENNFYQPLIMGHTMQLHPVTIMIGLLIFQHFFGILGMVIATPVIATLKVLFTFFNERYNFIGKKENAKIVQL
ncbi:MAG: AI-2E family transporter [Bacilli bacterium]|nr:AI-2E family transporter [Bacilli bacterium]